MADVVVARNVLEDVDNSNSDDGVLSIIWRIYLM